MSDIVERLLAQRDEARQSLALAHVEIGALNAEIERLRTEIELLHAELRVTKKLGLAALQDAMRQAGTGEE